MRGLIALLMTVSLLGCGHHGRMQEVIDAYDGGDFSLAAEVMRPVWEKYRDDDVDAVIFDLEQGAIARAAGQFNQSIIAFNESWDRMSPYLDIAADVKVSEEVAAALTNQSIRTYRGTTYDRIMANTFQALNYLQINEPQKAGVEFVRARNWQNDAVERERKRIKEENDLWRKSNDAQNTGYDPDRSLGDSGFRAQLRQAYRAAAQFKGYADYEIPVATWLRGLFYLGRGDPSDIEQARQCFMRVAGMLPEPDGLMIAADMQMAEQIASGAPMPRMCYVLMESGIAPSRGEIRLDIPLFLDGVPYVGAAFATLEYHGNEVTGFTATRTGDGVASASGESHSSSMITDMDSIVSKDFNNRLGGMIIATLVSSASKAAMTYALKQGLGNLGALAGVLYQVGMNSADLRTWETLPKRFYCARIPMPATGGEIAITMADGTQIPPLKPPSDLISIVYIKTTAAGTAPSVRTFGISRQRPFVIPRQRPFVIPRQ